ncbi:MAG: YlbF family regulator [Planctomycetota bacterium]|nr:YlbF family regulator [Planctomycetota bacterium]
MADVMEFANQLGAALAEDARYVAMRAATEALKEDAGAKKLEEEYAEAVQLIHQKTAQGAAIEPEDKKRELDLRNKIAANEKITALLRAQADFQELMNQVNEAIQEKINSDDQAA